MQLSSLCSANQVLLFRLFVENRAIQSIKISGFGTSEQCKFCQKLLKERPYLDIMFIKEGVGKTVFLPIAGRTLKCPTTYVARFFSVEI
jgi:hypothetical protein